MNSTQLRLPKHWVILILMCTFRITTFSQQNSVDVNAGTANSFSSYLPYDAPYAYGMNTGWFGGHFKMGDIDQLAYNGGARSLRTSLPDWLISGYGVETNLAGYEYLNKLGIIDLTAFVGQPNEPGRNSLGGVDNRETTIFPGCTERAHTFKGIYEPIWLNAAKTQINPANTFAAYLYKTVTTYGKYVKCWEVINEPDFSYATDAWAPATTPTSWFNRNPRPDELPNLKAPVFYYIRMMRIAWDVIKTLRPDSYVCPGGVGYQSFLDVMMRNTDNPVDGSVTPEYPLGGGAYFDMMSYHTYPHYVLNYWDNATSSMKFRRHSDYAVSVYLRGKDELGKFMADHGYDDIKYPAKQFIVTETDLARETIGNEWGSVEASNNYIVKCHVLSQVTGIKQLYKFALGDGADNNAIFNKMGVYGDLTSPTTTVANAPKNEIFKATSTVTALLYGKKVDLVKTAALNLPANIKGGAFLGPDNKYTYVLWAATTTDLSEEASATYTFPFEFEGIRRERDFTATGKSVNSKGTVALTSSPSYFIDTMPIPNQNPIANAGDNKTITLPVNTITLTGSGEDYDGSIVSYEWAQITGPSTASIQTPGAASTVINNLVAGTYTFQLKVTDNKGASGTATATVTVNKLPNVLPVAQAGEDKVLTLPIDKITLDGSASYDTDGTIAGYNWSKIEGPNPFTILNSNTATPVLPFLSEGIYVFELTVTDNEGGTATDRIRIEVKGSEGTRPVANAGDNQVIYLPLTSVTLDGKNSYDPLGTITSYKWKFIDGPQAASIISPGMVSTQVKGLLAGEYTFELTVTNNRGISSQATVKVTVNGNRQTEPETIIVYPNPVQATLSIKLKSHIADESVLITIYNTGGAAVISQAVKKTTFSEIINLNVGGLPKGIYFLELAINGKDKIVRKIIKN